MIEILGAIGAINALLLVLLLGKMKNKTVSDRILIAWVFNFALYFGNYFLFERQIFKLDVLWTLVWGISLISHPVFLYVYTISLAKKRFIFNAKVACNFLVLIPWAISMIPYLLLSTEQQESLVYNKQSISYELFVPMMIQLCIELFYFIRTLITIMHHQHNIEKEFSYHAKINLSWLKLLTYLYIIILISSMTGYSLVSSKILNIKVMDDLLMVVRMILFFYMVYHGFKQRLIYNPEMQMNQDSKKKLNPIKLELADNGRTQAQESENNATVEKLRNIMANEHLYLEQELSLGEMANKLGIHAHQLSKLLNIHLNKNFFEFVNEYRVEEFKKLACNPKNKHISILGLAMEAGFNSKATFNRFFKNSTGLTPSEFMKSYKF